jgi:hypothetical protein
MATLSYPRHSLVRRIHKNKLAAELPFHLQEVQQIHNVNYGILVSSILIALSIIALAWLITVNSTKARMLDQTKDIAGASQTVSPAEQLAPPRLANY